MQALNEHLIQRGKEIMTEYVTADNQCLEDSRTSNNAVLQALAACTGAQDSALFIQLVAKPFADPPEFLFEPVADTDRAELSVDGSVLLLNTLQKSLSDLDNYQKDVATQTKEIAGLKNLKEATEREGKGDAVDIWQQIIDSERALLVKDCPRLKTQTQIETIRSALGDVQLTQHQLKGTSSGNCVVCQQSLSLFSKGFACGGWLLFLFFAFFFFFLTPYLFFYYFFFF